MSNGGVALDAPSNRRWWILALCGLGSIGTALLNTIATSAMASYLSAHRPTSPIGHTAKEILAAKAATHADDVAFTVVVGLFVVAAVAAAVVFPGGRPAPSTSDAAAIVAA